MGMNSHTVMLKQEDVAKLRNILVEQGFELSDKPYAHYSGKKGKLNVTVYEKGPKVLVQGKETEDFVKFTLEPEILGEAILGYEEENDPNMFEPHFGVDESGKGDFLGPLVIAGVYTDKQSTRYLMDAGIMDSKRISSVARIQKLSKLIRFAPNVAYEVMVLKPEKYNELYDSFGNLNRLLAWGHARVIHSLARQRPDCPRALSDQFAKTEVLEKALREQGETVAHLELEQRTKGESDIAVAAASVLAREAFVSWMERASAAGGIELPLGASEKVIEAARDSVEIHGRDILPKIAKMHFKSSQQV